MNLVKLQRVSIRLNRKTIKLYSQLAVGVPNPNDFSESPKYPVIQDLSKKAVKKRERDAIHERIKKLTTVEEKQLALNLPRYYGFKSIIFKENRIPYDALPLVKFYTRTHLIHSTSLPDFYQQTQSTADAVVNEISSTVKEMIEYEYNGIQYGCEPALEKTTAEEIENNLAKRVSKQINRIIVNNVSQKLPHMLTAQVDLDPRHEAFWFIGGVTPPNNVRRYRNSIPWLKEGIEDPVDRSIQYFGSPILALRSDKPLKPFLPYSEAENPDFKVPKFTYAPQTVGFHTDHKHGANIPGFWPGETDEYGLLSIHGRGHLVKRKASFGEEDNLEAILCQGIISSFGWLTAQAAFQGFTPFNDLTYPLTTQTIITNGQYWSLFAYQLNTLLMHAEKVDENPKNNICFSTEPLKLFEGFDDQGKVIGLNEDVLKMIVQFYVNSPEERDHEMKPYLGEREKYAADIEYEDRRDWLEKNYKRVASNRPRHRLPHEVYNWEYIYKIVHNTRQHEPKRRPFELMQYPYKRRLDEHTSEYIPKVLRPYPRHGKKFTRTYYPKIYED